MDNVPSELTCNWTSMAAAGATGNGSGSGDINETLFMPAGSSVTYTATCAVDLSATGTLSNTASLSSPVPDLNSTNDSATDNDTVFVPQADLSISKTDGVMTAVPGHSVTYTLVVGNSGPSSDPSVSVTDNFPAGLTCAFTSVAAGGAAGHTVAGSGNLSETLSMPPGSSVTYTAVCAIDSSATGTLSNTATITGSVADPTPGNNSATDGDTTLSPEADLAITKTDGLTSVAPGQDVTYTIVATNNGPSDDPNVSVTDVFPSALMGVSWTCSATAGSSCTAAGSGDIAETVGLQAGGSVTFVATGTIDSSFVGVLSNTADVAAGPGVTDTDASNNQANDVTTVASPAMISALKTVQGDFREGGIISYLISLTNSGPFAQLDNPGHELIDTLPPELELISATASAGNAVVDLPLNTVTWDGAIGVGQVVEVMIEAQVRSGTGGATISNQGIVSFDSDGDGTNESSVSTDDPSAGGGGAPTTFVVLTAVEVPALDHLGILVLAFLFIGAALVRIRRL